MNLKEQQYVCTLARCQSISRAAEELFISPSALSVYISNLEKYLGVKQGSVTPFGLMNNIWESACLSGRVREKHLC